MEEMIIYIAIGYMSLIYLLIGLGINEKNAEYLLAGYNTASEDKKKEFDLTKYLMFFKPFFIRLSLFPLLSWLFVSLLINRDQMQILLWSFLQLTPFVFFLKKSVGTNWDIEQ
jgi:hypothetical protein